MFKNFISALYAELTKASQDNETTLNWGCRKCLQKDKTNPSSSSSSEFNKLHGEFKIMFSKLENFETKISKRLDVMDSCFKSVIAELKQETNEKIDIVKQDVSDNKSAIATITRELVGVKRQLSDIHRLNNLSCVTISGVPKLSTESNFDLGIVQRITQHYNVNLSRGSIIFCSRLKTAKASIIPPILVRFESRHLADELFKAYFESDPLLLSDISSETINSRVYINEYLTIQNYKIYKDCLWLKKQKYIEKVVRRRGIIYVSDQANLNLTRIESMERLLEKYPVLKTKPKYIRNSNHPNSSLAVEGTSGNVASVNTLIENNVDVNVNTSASMSEYASGESSS